MSLRNTRQRAAIKRALETATGFRSAQQLYDELRDAGEKVGLTTVYRTLQALAEAGELDVLTGAEGEAIYRRCRSDGHHHHLVCRDCGHAVEITAEEIEAWASRVADRHGFARVEHTAELYGTCADCRA